MLNETTSFQDYVLGWLCAREYVVERNRILFVLETRSRKLLKSEYSPLVLIVCSLVMFVSCPPDIVSILKYFKVIVNQFFIKIKIAF